MSAVSALLSFLIPSTARADGHDVAKAVHRHCRLIGCDESNTVAAVNTALRSPGDTLYAIRAGNRRADQLHYRQQQLQGGRT